MRKPSQPFLDMQTSIKDAKDHLLAMSQLLVSWKQCNQAARVHLATAAEWQIENVANTAKTTRPVARG
jgi:hypothetical protein